MAQRVFFSFHYKNDINRSMIVRNSWVTQCKETAGFIDKTDFKQVKRRGYNTCLPRINKQLEGTSVTVFLIGNETLNSSFAQYEIRESFIKVNAIIGVKIHNICDGIYDCINDDGYNNLGDWIERATKARNKQIGELFKWMKTIKLSI